MEITNSNSYEWSLCIENFSILVCYVRKISPKKKNKNRFVKILVDGSVNRTKENQGPWPDNEVNHGTFVGTNAPFGLGIAVKSEMVSFLTKTISYFDFACLQKRIEKIEGNQYRYLDVGRER